MAALTLVPASAACSLDHCPRSKPKDKEGLSASWSLEHMQLGEGVTRSRYTQSSFHLRYPLSRHWRIGGHLPFGYLRTGSSGYWGLSNPMAYAERASRLSERQALTLGLQAELPVGDDESGIASGHAMAMPYASYTLQGNRVLMQASTGLSARIPGGSSHGAAGEAGHNHSLQDGSAAGSQPGTAGIQVNPHEAYEILYRFGLTFPLRRFHLEPEINLSGTRVLFPSEDAASDFVSAEAALGFRLAGDLVLKPRWVQQLTHPARFAWSTGLDVKFDFPIH